MNFIPLFINRLPRLSFQKKCFFAELLGRDSGTEQVVNSFGELFPLWSREELNKALRSARRDAETLEKSGLSVLTYRSPLYPEALKKTASPPFLLFLKGAGLPSGNRRWAVVGTRRPTLEGERAAFEAGLESAGADTEVVSGMASGIDTAAHNGALAGGGRTRAVLAGGLNTLSGFRKEQAEEIVRKGGTLISEDAPDTIPRPYLFPKRNRLISGLASVLLLIEAPPRSGALITLKSALAEKKRVLIHRLSLAPVFREGVKPFLGEPVSVISGKGDLMSALTGRDVPGRESIREAEKSQERHEEKGSGFADVRQAGVRQALGLSAEWAGRRILYKGAWFCP